MLNERVGFQKIELGFPDILAYASKVHGREIKPDDYATLTKVAQDIKGLVSSNGLQILMLQPFANFEGRPRGSPERAQAFEKARGWIEIMKAVGTDMLQVSIFY